MFDIKIKNILVEYDKESLEITNIVLHDFDDTFCINGYQILNDEKENFKNFFKIFILFNCFFNFTDLQIQYYILFYNLINKDLIQQQLNDYFIYLWKNYFNIKYNNEILVDELQNLQFHKSIKILKLAIDKKDKMCILLTIVIYLYCIGFFLSDYKKIYKLFNFKDFLLMIIDKFKNILCTDIEITELENDNIADINKNIGIPINKSISASKFESIETYEDIKQLLNTELNLFT